MTDVMPRQRCEIVQFSVPVYPTLGLGPWRAECQCMTHSFIGNVTTEEGLCPIGRIEKATEEALAKIAAAGDRNEQ